MTIGGFDGARPERWIGRRLARGSRPPLLDDAKLNDLRTQLGDPDVEAFLQAFIDEWPHRLARLHQALDAGDRELCIDAILSISVSCQMVGAPRLVWIAAQLHSYLLLDKPRAVARRMPFLRRVGEQTTRAMTYRARARR